MQANGCDFGRGFERTQADSLCALCPIRCEAAAVAELPHSQACDAALQSDFSTTFSSASSISSVVNSAGSGRHSPISMRIERRFDQATSELPCRPLKRLS